MLFNSSAPGDKNVFIKIAGRCKEFSAFIGRKHFGLLNFVYFHDIAGHLKAFLIYGIDIVPDLKCLMACKVKTRTTDSAERLENRVINEYCAFWDTKGKV